MDRRRFLLDAAALAFVSRFAAAQTFAAPSAVVNTSSGQLRGELVDGVRIFRGVPFAQPPVGPLRFRAPQPVAPWKGVRDATRFAAAAPQPGAANVPQSEDCLYLNIWAPADPGSHPVFVWIHGGGFTGGHSFEPLFDGARFAREGIVVVTVAYRLGVLGFLDVRPMFEASYSGSANNGIRDLLAALTWVQKNIAAFGGDPGRVTIGGESAGAKLTDLLMGISAARPLFQQMISESGGAERIFSAAIAEAVGIDFAHMWVDACKHDQMALRSAPAGDLIACQERFMRDYPLHFPLRPEVDGKLFQASPIEAIRSGNTRGKRLLLGTNRDESAMFLGPHPAGDPTAKDLGNLPLAKFSQLAAKYAQLYPDMPADLRRIRSVTAEEYWIPSIRVAEAHVQGGGTAFVYRFDHEARSGRYTGRAYHASELPFVWDNMQGHAADGSDQAFAGTMHTAWANFIRTGIPQAPSLPAWSAYNTNTRATMLLDTTSRMENNPQAAELAAWSGLLEH